MVIDVEPRPWWAGAFDRAAEMVIFVGVGLLVAGAAWAGLARVLRRKDAVLLDGARDLQVEEGADPVVALSHQAAAVRRPA